MGIALLALVLTVGAEGPRVATAQPVHLSLVFRSHDPDGVAALIAGQRDPTSPDYGRFLTPAAFGRRFGQTDATLDAAIGWLTAAGLRVEPSPNQLYLGATGSAAQVEALLGIELHGTRFRRAVGTPQIPERLRSELLTISGLDTRPTFRPALQWASSLGGMGPQDIRRFYGLQPLLDQGIVGRGQQMATLAIAESTLPDAAVIGWFYANVANASVAYSADVVANPSNEFDDAIGNSEFEIDAEMQSIAAPGAAKSIQVIAPESELLTSGINEIVSNLPGVTAVSISLSSCESPAAPILAARTLIQQGVAEGQTWFAASGDLGVDIACTAGVVPGASFPASVPEVVAVGGTEAPVVFDDAGAATGYVAESVWASATGASGAAASALFAAPAWQVGLGAGDGGRRVPDISLLAGGGLTALASTGTNVGTLGAVVGTSVSAPLAAGVFTLLADALGCRLGLVQPTLYALGLAQEDGGAAVFHDVTSGSNSFPGTPGLEAGVGYDRVSGWGSVDLTALIAAWPACAAGLAFADAGPRVPYAPCPSCDAGTQCVPFFAEGPVWCGPVCAGSATADCYLDCSGCQYTDYACQAYDAGFLLCVPSCFRDSDCDYLPGTACNALGECAVPGADAGAGDGGVSAGSSGCGCESGAGGELSFALVALLALRRKLRV